LTVHCLESQMVQLLVKLLAVEKACLMVNCWEDLTA
jgi:hypothetical protein